MKGVDITHVLVAVIGACATIVSAWLAYRRGQSKTNSIRDLTRHYLFGGIRYLREVVVPQIDVGNHKKTLCVRKFLTIKLEVFEDGIKKWVLDLEKMNNVDFVGYLAELVQKCREKALKAGIPMIFIERFEDIHLPAIDSIVESLSRIMASEMCDHEKKQALVLDILFYAFMRTIKSAESVAMLLNGELEKALNEISFE